MWGYHTFEEFTMIIALYCKHTYKETSVARCVAYRRRRRRDQNSNASAFGAMGYPEELLLNIPDYISAATNHSMYIFMS